MRSSAAANEARRVVSSQTDAVFRQIYRKQIHSAKHFDSPKSSSDRWRGFRLWRTGGRGLPCQSPEPPRNRKRRQRLHIESLATLWSTSRFVGIHHLRFSP